MKRIRTIQTTVALDGSRVEDHTSTVVLADDEADRDFAAEVALSMMFGWQLVDVGEGWAEVHAVRDVGIVRRRLEIIDYDPKEALA